MHGLEGARDDALASRVVFGPRVEVGLRHDGEDAETSAGLDVGGGLVVSDSSTGLAVDLRGCGCWCCTRPRGSASGPWRPR